ncbi:hypothetical protein TVAG_436710 [Trichomonas vaginalis G3]|uniref:Uncharacterized protein n=1 Tax=Trichomonas vaginalis (strain ATCC PRA-98 / G3) TaxID=412133 RepID=A2DFB9_TRIV3|nr:hypothetical protein TVAGG3_0565490 [Trichomonas vaginalis G3]EAY20847.1 hypothetical protein TVAG_436710 [Trichomonas vaginalis G3]KAI5521542.1 hypothetical protein TVAGG3_0565490 [Trichomonas vaginalis G3]|eukprot:XP_001581833.1 hypothetical protein [Trichomonas vaginalis G3]
MEEEITLLDDYTYLPSCAVIEVFSGDVMSIFTKVLFSAYKLSKVNVSVGVNSLNIKNPLIGYIETVLQRKLIFIKSQIPPKYCWNNTIRYSSEVTPEEVDKSYFDEIRKRFVSFSLPLKEKIVTNVPKSRFSDFDIGLEIVSIDGMNFLDKIIPMIDAKYFVYFENDQDGFMMTYLPDDSITYVIHTYHSDSDSKTISFMKKSGRKIKFVEQNQLKETLENDFRNSSQ